MIEINRNGKATLDTKVSVEMTVEALVYLLAVVGHQSNDSSRELLEDMIAVRSDFTSNVDVERCGDMYDDILAFLRKEGIVHHS